MAPVSLFPDFMNWAAVLLMLVGGGLPLGVPPAPEDPLVSRVAPEECLIYVNWSGMAKPDPASRNQTEQLLAEAEVRACLAELQPRILEILHRQSASDPQAEALIEPVTTLVKAVFTSPTAVFISRIDRSGKTPGPRGGTLVHLGDKTAQVSQALAAIEKAAAAGLAKKPGDKAQAAKPWHDMPLGHMGSLVQWTIKDDCLIVGVGEGEGDKILARMQQNPPAWLGKIRQQLAVPRLSNLAYVNVAGILKTAGEGIPPDNRALLDALGLTRVRSVACITGLDDSGCVTKLHVAVDGEPQGLLSVFTGKPLSKEQIALIPKDATLAAAARLDLAKAYQTVFDTLGRVDPRARDELLSGVAEFEKGRKLKLSRDILESLGDVWRVYNSPTEGGLIVTGLTAVVDLRDRDRLVAANAKLVFGSLAGGLAKQLTGQDRGRETPTIRQTRFGKHTIFVLNTDGRFHLPAAPAWCITDTELVVALYPQNVRAYLSRGNDGPPTGSLADVPAAAGLFAGNQSPMAVGYVDTPYLFKTVYPLVQMLLHSFFGDVRGDLAIDIALLPSALSIVRHLQPTVVSVQRDASGILIESRRTFPVLSGLFTGPSLLAGWAISGGSHAIATPQSVSTNNLKQILLGMHNYHTAYNHFPAAAAPQKAGQPPVSWRVRLLPFLEENALYEQYRFDEPWDSEHNKKLLAQMPAVFAAPGSSVAAEGKTNYLAVVGNDYGLAADKGRQIMEIRDGTSNTLLVVEVSDAKAVPWTKPEDYAVDKTKPAAGLVGLRPGGFLAGVADGSVRRIPAGIDAASLNALFTRAGGEIVNTEEVLRDR